MWKEAVFACWWDERWWSGGEGDSRGGVSAAEQRNRQLLSLRDLIVSVGRVRAHELGHLKVVDCLNYKTIEVTWFDLGGDSQIAGSAVGAWGTFLIKAGGAEAPGG